MLRGKRIVLGITGSIAAYKIPLLVRLLAKEGAEVRIVMSSSANDFVTAETLATLSNHPVAKDFYKNKVEGTWHNHVEYGGWADLLLIAPLSANTLSKMAHGACDNLLSAIYLSAKCPVMVAPAMDLDMYQHPAVINNLKILEKFGNQIIPAEDGELASGLSGKGRLAEPETIFEQVKLFFSENSNKWKGKTVTITAGPTYERIDPVRFIGNFSSGKMGVSLARAFVDEGAKVNLILGPSSIHDIPKSVKVISVTSAEEMLDQVKKLKDQTDVFVAAAAVSDYRPKNEAPQKIKKSHSEMQIELVKNPDILSYFGQHKTPGQLVVGFALETENELENAMGKLVKKNLDFIVLNSMNDEGATFQSDFNKVTLISKDNKIQELKLDTKDKIAEQIVNLIHK